MKSLALAFVAAIAVVSSAQANVLMDLAKTSSTITPHGLFDGR